IVVQATSPGGPNWFTPSPPQGIQALNEFQANPTYENMVTIMKNFVPNPELLPEEMIQRRFEMALVPGHLESRDRNRNTRNADLRSEVGQLQVPVLVVWGDQDRMVPMEGALAALSA